MRKASRQKDPAWALDVMDRAPYMLVSMSRPDGTPYGVPLSVARKDERVFYFHGNRTGNAFSDGKLLKRE